MAYNLKTITYEATGEQVIVTYSRAIKTGQDRPEPEDGNEEHSELEHLEPPTPEKLLQKARHSLNTSQNRTMQQVYDYARANVWEWFVTLTTSAKQVDRLDDEQVEQKLSKWLNNMRYKKAPDIKYLVVKERHKDGALHFHALMANTGQLMFREAENNGNGIWHNGQQVYNLTDWKLGFSTATRIKDTLRASNYITKYITKDMVTEKHRKRYWASKNLLTGQVETALLDSVGMLAIHDAYTETAKHTKKIVVAGHDYQNEIMYFTIETDKESVPDGNTTNQDHEEPVGVSGIEEGERVVLRGLRNEASAPRSAHVHRLRDAD